MAFSLIDSLYDIHIKTKQIKNTLYNFVECIFADFRLLEQR